MWFHDIAGIQTLQDGKKYILTTNADSGGLLHPLLLFYYCLWVSLRGDGSAEFTNFHFWFLFETYSILIYSKFTKFIFHWSKAIQAHNYILSGNKGNHAFTARSSLKFIFSWKTELMSSYRLLPCTGNWLQN